MDLSDIRFVACYIMTCNCVVLFDIVQYFLEEIVVITIIISMKFHRIPGKNNKTFFIAITPFTIYGGEVDDWFKSW